MKRLSIKRSTYQDSFNLMLLANQAQKIKGVREAALFMGTVANKRRLEAAGYVLEDVGSIDNNDLVIALDVDSERTFSTVMDSIDQNMAGFNTAAGVTASGMNLRPSSLEGAMRVFKNPDLVSISLPGEYAWREAKTALENDLHVFLFSDNVPIEKEVELKQLANSKGLLMMGPDCGTARIGAKGLGFCNVVASGEIGIVAASGTGAQEVMCLLDRLGAGVSHILGTGGRDLDQQVGGITTLMSLKALDLDPATKVIMLISKPADPEIQDQIAHQVAALQKPLIACFIGENTLENKPGQIWWRAKDLDHAARLAASILKGTTAPTPQSLGDFAVRHKDWINFNQSKFAAGQRYIRGLYSGGSLADETAAILAETLQNVRAGDGFGKVLPIKDWENSSGHMIMDLGEDRFTQGRPHPMIDQRIRLERLRQEGNDPSVAVILFDVVLGYNAHPDPAGELKDEIKTILKKAAKDQRNLVLIAHVCGTDKDPQGYSSQVEQLEKAGCRTVSSNAEAALAALSLVAPRSESRQAE